jgi:UDP-N-acetylmuramoyl-L-alanyl-D-glutamate--2,6-diaminopimelate ligase
MLPEETFIKKLERLTNYSITGVQCNSKLIEKGNIFVAINGHECDGHNYISDAVKRGAIAIVGERDMKNLPMPFVKVANSRKSLGKLAAHFYHHPANNHKIIAITGTNGKTTTAYMLQHIITSIGERCSLFGTVAHVINNKKIRAQNTTPDPLLLQKLLSESNDKFVVMEASSHGIDQHRLEGITIDYGYFTNLSHEHLDYHKNLESYFNVKASLFQMLKKHGEAIIGTYSVWGNHLKQRLLQEEKPVFSIGEKKSDDIQLVKVDQRFNKTIFHIKDNKKQVSLVSPLPGLHNIWNAMQAYLGCRRLGIEPKEIIQALNTFQGVPGRFEQYKHPLKAKFIVDYAHTPDAIIHCLATSRSFTRGKLVHIFGFRGKRDRTKREKMLQASLHLSDETIITLDDLNGEDMQHVSSEINELVEKFKGKPCKIIFDRTEAIKYAWIHTQVGDTVLVTGKGPEEYEQTFSLPCTSDRETILSLNRDDHENILFG